MPSGAFAIMLVSTGNAVTCMDGYWELMVDRSVILTIEHITNGHDVWMVGA